MARFQRASRNVKRTRECQKSHELKLTFTSTSASLSHFSQKNRIFHNLLQVGSSVHFILTFQFYEEKIGKNVPTPIPSSINSRFYLQGVSVSIGKSWAFFAAKFSLPKQSICHLHLKLKSKSRTHKEKSKMLLILLV